MKSLAGFSQAKAGLRGFHVVEVGLLSVKGGSDAVPATNM
jgi:hypothetical protein